MAGNQRPFNLTLQLGGKVSSSLNKAFKDVNANVQKLGTTSQAATSNISSGFSAAARSANHFNAATVKANHNLAKVAQTAAKIQKQTAGKGITGSVLTGSAIGSTIGTTIGNVIGAIPGTVVRGISRFVSDAMQASREQMTGELGLVLAASLRNNPGLQDAEIENQKKRIEDLAEAMRKYSAIDDATFRSGFAELATFGAKAKGIEDLGKAFADYLAMTEGLTASPEAAKSLADKIGIAVTTGEFERFRKELKLTRDEATKFAALKTAPERIEVLRKALESRAGGQAASVAGSWQGQAALAKEEVDQIMSVYGDEFRKIEGRFDVFKAKILKDLLPSLQPAIEEVKKGANYLLEHADQIEGKIRGWFSPEKIKDAENWIGRNISQFQVAWEWVKKIENGINAINDASAAAGKTVRETLLKQLENTKQVAEGVAQALIPLTPKETGAVIEDQQERAAKGGAVGGQYNPNAFPDSPEMRKYIEDHKKTSAQLEKLQRTTEDVNSVLIDFGSALAFIHPGNVSPGTPGVPVAGASGIVPGMSASGNYRAMGFGPAAGDTNHAANYSDYGSGPVDRTGKHLLLPNDIAVSPNLLGRFPMGSYVNIVDHKTGKVLHERQKVADTSWRAPGKPTYNTFEQRHVQDMGHADLVPWKPRIPLKPDQSSAAPASGHTINAPVTIHVTGVPDKRTAEEAASRMHGSIREHLDRMDEAYRARKRTMLS